MPAWRQIPVPHCIYVDYGGSSRWLRSSACWQSSGFDPDSVDLFNDRIEIAGECSVKDIEFPEAFVKISESDPLPQTRKRKRQKVRPYIANCHTEP